MVQLTIDSIWSKYKQIFHEWQLISKISRIAQHPTTAILKVYSHFNRIVSISSQNKPYLISLIVLSSDQKNTSNEKIQEEINKMNQNLSKIEKVKKFFVIKEQFTIENGMMTPTLKLKRYKIIKKYKTELEKLY